MSRVRDHWSIGEVLSLLQDEFPEVTISKIRFLESQGLIDPERTPSGYRKFSDDDYDRLYWILEQQRDHYLPLRVIRDRLEDGQEISPAPRREDHRIGQEITDDGGDYVDDDDAELAGENGFRAERGDDEESLFDASPYDDDTPYDIGDPAPAPTAVPIYDSQAVEGDFSQEESPIEATHDSDSPSQESSEPDHGAAEPASEESSESVPSMALGTFRGQPMPGGRRESDRIAAGRRMLYDGAADLDLDYESSQAEEIPYRPMATDPDAALDNTFALALAQQVGPVPPFDPAAEHPVQRAEDNNMAGAVTNNQPATQAHPGGPTEPPASTISETTEPDAADSPPAAAPPTGGVHRRRSTGTPIDDSEEEPMNVEDAESRSAPRLLGTRSEPPRPITKTTAEALKPQPRPSLPGSSVALTREELAEQSGCSPGAIAELEKHGMLVPRNVGGSILFDSTALTLARLAVQFSRYGLEPRHLRTFRLSAEREVALLTQSIGPTLKANNAETRRRSYDTLQDLAELSASLRSIIVRDLVADLEPEG